MRSSCGVSISTGREWDWAGRPCAFHSRTVRSVGNKHSLLASAGAGRCLPYTYKGQHTLCMLHMLGTVGNAGIIKLRCASQALESESDLCCCLYDFTGLCVLLHAGIQVRFPSEPSIGNALSGRYVAESRPGSHSKVSV